MRMIKIVKNRINAKSVETLLKVALYTISNFALADRVQSMAGMSISVDVEIWKTGKNCLKRKV